MEGGDIVRGGTVSAGGTGSGTGVRGKHGRGLGGGCGQGARRSATKGGDQGLVAAPHMAEADSDGGVEGRCFPNKCKFFKWLTVKPSPFFLQSHAAGERKSGGAAFALTA